MTVTNLKSLDVRTQLPVTTMRMLLTTTVLVPNSTSVGMRMEDGIADGACDCDGNGPSRPTATATASTTDGDGDEFEVAGYGRNRL